MAVRVYHGTGTERSEPNIYRVVINDTDLISGFQFNEGDLLSVYFTIDHNNADNAPQLVIYNGDSASEQSIIGDNGKVIHRVRDQFVVNREDNAAKAWEQGEVVLFCYQKVANSENNYYWQMVDGGYADQELYGVTKLFGTDAAKVEGQDSFLKWLATPATNAEDQVAATPALLKFLYGAITTGQEPEKTEDPVGPDQTQPQFGLIWTPNPELTGTKEPLGTLKLDEAAEGIVIDFPLTQTIVDIVTPLLPSVLTHTSQLINDGHAADDPDNGDTTTDPVKPRKADGTFYITNRLIDRNIYLDGGKGLIKDGDSYPFILKDPSETEENPYTLGNEGVVIIDPALRTGAITSTSLITGPITSGAITAGGIIDAGANQIKTTGHIYGNRIYRDNIEIDNIYSHRLITQYFSRNITIGKNNSVHAQKIDVTKPGYTPIAVSWINIDEQTPETGAPSFCHLWEWYLGSEGTGNNKKDYLYYGIRNYWSQKNFIIVKTKILYVQN